MESETKKYKTTKEECQKRIDEYNGVCPGCGGILVPIETVDNSDHPTFWAGCERCMTYSNGVRPRVFKIAEAMVKTHNHQPYRHHQFPREGTDAEKEYYYTSQIRGTCSEVQLVLRLNEEFKEERN